MGLRDDFEFDPDTFTSQETGGLLGRLLALHAEQSQYQPVADNSAQPAFAPNNPSRRPLPQVPAAPIPPRGAIGPSNLPLPPGQSAPAYSPFGNGDAPDWLRSSQMQQDQYQPSARDSAELQQRSFVQAIQNSAQKLGIEPLDLATVISYETGGRFDPDLWSKDHTHLGLIQFGGPERADYGAKEGQSPAEQMAAVERFLRARGVRPDKKMGLLNLYSVINTGSPDNFGLSDAKEGGAPGTVAEKVAGMGDHKANAARLLAKYAPPAFPTTPQPPVRVLSGWPAGEPNSLDSDTPAPRWREPPQIFNPRR
jgi:hypothetical protein